MTQFSPNADRLLQIMDDAHDDLRAAIDAYKLAEEADQEAHAADRVRSKIGLKNPFSN